MNIRISYPRPVRTVAALFSIFATLNLVSTAYSITIVAPNANTSAEGSDQNPLPFATTGHIQQLFSSSQFSSLGGPQLITQIAFRPDATLGQAFSVTRNTEITLSTTTRPIGGLSTTFSQNIGSNVTPVFSGVLAISSAFAGPATGPKDFDIVVNFITPFLYDPSAGNLLMDVKNFGGSGGNTGSFDAASNGTLSRLRSSDVNSLTGDIAADGLVTRFTTASISVPDSSDSVALLVLSMAGLVALRRYRRI
jgi:hypothetical protein